MKRLESDLFHLTIHIFLRGFSVQDHLNSLGENIRLKRLVDKVLNAKVKGCDLQLRLLLSRYHDNGESVGISL